MTTQWTTERIQAAVARHATPLFQMVITIFDAQQLLREVADSHSAQLVAQQIRIQELEKQLATVIAERDELSEKE